MTTVAINFKFFSSKYVSLAGNSFVLWGYWFYFELHSFRYLHGVLKNVYRIVEFDICQAFIWVKRKSG